MNRTVTLFLDSSGYYNLVVKNQEQVIEWEGGFDTLEQACDYIKNNITLEA